MLQSTVNTRSLLRIAATVLIVATMAEESRSQPRMLTLAGAEQKAVKSQWNGVFTAAQANRGRDAYAQYCANCHGVNLAGLPQEVRYEGQSPFTPALVGEQFAANWNGLSVGRLFDVSDVNATTEPGKPAAPNSGRHPGFMLEQAGYLPGASRAPKRRCVGQRHLLKARPNPSPTLPNCVP
jgi:mono/diheme cytochrome c family protein